MPKCLAVLLVLGLAGCSSAPLMSAGLSAEPAGRASVDYVEERTVVRRAPARRVVVERIRQPTVVTTTKVVSPASTSGEEPADRAARKLDDDVQRLERAARAATSSICRGC